MARTVDVIKKGMTDAFMSDTNLASAYGFTLNSDFYAFFSKFSIESIIFYIVAYALWLVESLFDIHKSEMTTLLDTDKPHRLKWYTDKVLAFQFGRSLAQDSDVYDTIVDSEIVVQFASANEYQGRVYIKVKGANGTLTSDQQTALQAYLADIKDAGVKIGDDPTNTTVINEAADHFSAQLNIYYDPMVFNASGLNLSTGLNTVSDTIKDFVQNQMPFNGEYRNVSLIDALQLIDGVVIPDILLVKKITHADFLAGNVQWTNIAVKDLPDSGYYEIYNDSDLVLNFIPYQSVL